MSRRGAAEFRRWVENNWGEVTPSSQNEPGSIDIECFSCPCCFRVQQVRLQSDDGIWIYECTDCRATVISYRVFFNGQTGELFLEFERPRKRKS